MFDISSNQEVTRIALTRDESPNPDKVARAVLTKDEIRPLNEIDRIALVRHEILHTDKVARVVLRRNWILTPTVDEVVQIARVILTKDRI
ncbi:hypothetical protein THAR02_03695 [Trichoderma harzianum]|uniref:Uncharacterized protein n=1 Tax=Trichoderma harzianum TaxID=5544 RepID=A0A0F9ZVR8_TRIHA|nr:hypothetical protein THAR02_03695 [Trichoderma harzianum]